MLWGKYKVHKSFAAYILGIGHPVVVVGRPVIADRAHKIFIEYRDKIFVDVYILIHAAEHFADAGTVESHCFYRLDHFPRFSRVPLVIIVGERFG